MTDLIVGSEGFIGKALTRKCSLSDTLTIGSPDSFQAFINTQKVRHFNSVYWLAGSAKPSNESLGSPHNHRDFIDLYRFLSTTTVFNQFVFLSSGGCVYGPGEGPFDEIGSTSPVNFYGQIKLACENLIKSTIESKACILRLSNVHGASQQVKGSQGIIPYWLDAIKNKRKIQVYGSLDDFRDYISISDATTAILTIGEQKLFGTYNIGSGERISLLEILIMIEQAIGYRPEYEILPRRCGDRKGYSLEIGKIKDHSTWRPAIDSQKSLKETMLAMHSNLTENNS